MTCCAEAACSGVCRETRPQYTLVSMLICLSEQILPNGCTSIFVSEFRRKYVSLLLCLNGYLVVSCIAPVYFPHQTTKHSKQLTHPRRMKSPTRDGITGGDHERVIYIYLHSSIYIIVRYVYAGLFFIMWGWSTFAIQVYEKTIYLKDIHVKTGSKKWRLRIMF